jgi:allophanate hydrolase subunit 1
MDKNETYWGCKMGFLFPAKWLQISWKNYSFIILTFSYWQLSPNLAAFCYHNFLSLAEVIQVYYNNNNYRINGIIFDHLIFF